MVHFGCRALRSPPPLPINPRASQRSTHRNHASNRESQTLGVHGGTEVVPAPRKQHKTAIAGPFVFSSMPHPLADYQTLLHITAAARERADIREGRRGSRHDAALRGVGALPPRVLGIILSHLDPCTLLTVASAVSPTWRAAVSHLTDTPFDLTFAPRNSRLRAKVGDAQGVAAVLALAHRLPAATSIRLDGFSAATDALVVALVKGRPHTTDLQLRECGLSKASADAVATHCRGLRSIGLGDIPSVNDAWIETIAAGCPLLESIDLTGCHRVTDDAIVFLTNRCPRLRVVRFDGCPRVTDPGVAMLATGCPLLTKVGLSRCHHLTDTSCLSLATHCPQLAVVGLAGCNRITDRGVVALAQHCPLQTLDLRRCHNLTDKSVATLRGYCGATLRSVNLEGCRFAPPIEGMEDDAVRTR